MSQTALSTFYNDVRLDAPGCPDILILRALNRTIRDFCRRVPVLRKEQSIWLIQNRSCYELDVPANTKIGFIQSIVNSDGKKIEALNELELDKRSIGWRSIVSTNVEGYLMPVLGELRVYPIPEEMEVNALTVYFSLIPTKEAIDFESELADRYEQLLIDGAISWILLRPNQKWTNPAAAKIHMIEYETALQNAIIDTMRNNVRSEIKVTLRPLA